MAGHEGVTTMTKIYIVTEGECSGYSIEAVFSNRDIAQKYCDRFGGEIEDWEMDKFDEQCLHYNIYFIRINRNGDVIESEEETDWFHLNELNNPEQSGFDCNGNMYITVKAKTLEGAIKVAGERRARYIAEDKWNLDKRRSHEPRLKRQGMNEVI
jgi:hypothetical protein